MDKQELDNKIADAAKTILSYCTARTANSFEAEDLAQDIVLEIYKSADNIRDINAFYGFMWAVAGNVYKQWCKRKAKNCECELTEELCDEKELFEDESTDLYLLRRELTLLSQKYRKAAILYYIENKSCAEIATYLSISESMVKYLLFKTRQILKEGMNMERKYGKQSYNPKGLTLMYWGNGANRYYHLCDSKISQNILFACYNDKLTAEQISLEIGVSLPYMEDKLNELCEYELLKMDGNRYYTNMVIFTGEFTKEVNIKTAKLKEKIADILVSAIEKNEEQVRGIGFSGADMGNNAFKWQMTGFILYQAIINNLQKRIEITYPVDKFGTECFVWGVEEDNNGSTKSPFRFGICHVENEEGDLIRFMDFPINGEMAHFNFYNSRSATNVLLDVVKGETSKFSENDNVVAADLVRNGYLISGEDGLSVNAPVFTSEQYEVLKNIFADIIMEIANEAEVLMEAVTKIMKEHTPTHLKKQVKDMAFLRLFEDAISAPVAVLYDKKYLLAYDNQGLHPTTGIILK